MKNCLSNLLFLHFYCCRRPEGKVALITGGAMRLGESSARPFIKHGAKVLIANVQDEIGISLCKQIGLAVI